MAFLDSSGVTRLCIDLKARFQEKLVSGSNIKTINNSSILGSGNLSIASGGSSGFLITVSGTNSTGRTLDKTGREIVDAVNAGFAPVFKAADVNNVSFYPFVGVQYDSNTGYVKVQCNGFQGDFTASSFDNYPSIPPQGGGDN